MANYKKLYNVNTATLRLKKSVKSKWLLIDLNEVHDAAEDSDIMEVLYLRDLRFALKNLGGRLTNDEVDMLVKGINEDEEEGVQYEDFVRALIFASFFIATYDRRATGYITVKDLNKVMMYAQKLETSETCRDESDYDLLKNDVGTRRNDQNGKPNFYGIDMDPNEVLDYNNLIKTIEKTRLVFIRTIHI